MAIKMQTGDWTRVGNTVIMKTGKYKQHSFREILVRHKDADYLESLLLSEPLLKDVINYWLNVYPDIPRRVVE